MARRAAFLPAGYRYQYFFKENRSGGVGYILLFQRSADRLRTNVTVATLSPKTRKITPKPAGLATDNLYFHIIYILRTNGRGALLPLPKAMARKAECTFVVNPNTTVATGGG